LGGLTAWLVVMVGIHLLTPASAQLARSYGSTFTLTGPGMQDLEILLGSSTVLGWLGSWLAAARHLARIDPGSG
jgi:cell division transport system permease protein